MKRYKSIICGLLFIATILTACEKVQPMLNKSDYALNLTDNTTNKGIGIGDNAESFLAAYGEYDMEISVEGGYYQSMPIEEIPFDKPIQTILPTFFIDDIPTSIAQICEENEIQRIGLLPLLSSEEYLDAHAVSYYYLIFGWKDGVITEIRSEYMDYNKDAYYYEEISEELEEDSQTGAN